MTLSEDQWNDLREYQEALEHYGIPGMRWGHRKERRSSGRKQAAKKKAISNPARARREARAAKRAARAKERAKKREEQTRQREERAKIKLEKQRRDILNDPTKLYKHRREFSPEEIQSALKQFEWEQKLSDYSAKRLKNGAEFINTMFTYSNNAINLYNNAARFMNSVNKDSNSQLPVIKPLSEFYSKKDDKKKKDKKDDN